MLLWKIVIRDCQTIHLTTQSNGTVPLQLFLHPLSRWRSFIRISNRESTHWDPSFPSLTDSKVFSLGFLFRYTRKMMVWWSNWHNILKSQCTMQVYTVCMNQLLPVFELSEWFIEAFLIPLILSDLISMVDDGEGINQVGTEEGVYVFWQEFPHTSSVSWPVGKITYQFGCGCWIKRRGKSFAVQYWNLIKTFPFLFLKCVAYQSE